MLEHVSVTNFRCLCNVSASLSRLTVLIGQNDTGKSAFLDALGLALSTSSDHFLLEDIEHWGRSPQNSVGISLAFADGMETGVAREGPLGARYGRAKRPGFAACIFRLPVGGPAMQSTGAVEARGAPDMGVDAAQLPALLDHLLRTNRRRLFELENAA